MTISPFNEPAPRRKRGRPRKSETEPADGSSTKRAPARSPLKSGDIAAAKVLFTMMRDYYGNENQAVEWLRTFAGLVIKVPPPAAIEQLLMDRRVHAALSRDPSLETVRRLAVAHHTELRHVSKSFAKSNGGVGVKSLRAAANAAAAVEDGPSDEPE